MLPGIHRAGMQLVIVIGLIVSLNAMVRLLHCMSTLQFMGSFVYNIYTVFINTTSR